MKSLAVTAWMGMTIRNIFYSQTLEELNNRFELTVVSYYANELKAALPAIYRERKFIKLQVPRWRFPSLQGRLIRLLYEWNLHAFYRRHNVQNPDATFHVENWLLPEKEKNWVDPNSS